MAYLDLCPENPSSIDNVPLTTEDIITGIIAATDLEYRKKTLLPLAPEDQHDYITSTLSVDNHSDYVNCLLLATGTGFPKLQIEFKLKNPEENHEEKTFTILDTHTDKILIATDLSKTTPIYLTPEQYGDFICLLTWGRLGARPGDCT